MFNDFNNKIINLAKNLDCPLYVVGGSVRDFMLYKTNSFDIDLTSYISLEEFVVNLKKYGFTVKKIYSETGNVVFTDGIYNYEYTCFREDVYDKGGSHKPKKIVFTSDITLDAKRRDFKVNAIYFDLKNKKLIDPLNGLKDLKRKRLSCVKNPNLVLNNDGIRLLRLCRFMGELNLKPKKSVLFYAKKYKKNILEVNKQKVKEELDKIFLSDDNFYNKGNRYRLKSIKALDKLRIFDYLMNLKKYKKLKIDKAFKNLNKEELFLEIFYKKTKDKKIVINFLEDFGYGKKIIKKATQYYINNAK